MIQVICTLRVAAEAIHRAVASLPPLQAMGGSTNAVVHLAALCGRLGFRLDLDLLDYHGVVLSGLAGREGGPPLVLPHPGIPERGFVLGPIAEIAPHWRHPVLGETAPDLLKRLEERD